MHVQKVTLMKSIESPEYIVVQPDIHDEMLEKFKHPHRFELGCFLLVASGCANISVNLSSYELTDSCVVTVLPRSIIQLNRWSDDFRCELVAFSSDFVKDLTLIRSVITQKNNISNMPVLNLSRDESLLTKEYYELLLNIYRRSISKELKIGAVGNMLMSFFYCVCSMYDSRCISESDMLPVRREDLTRKFLALALKHCDKDREVKFYADKLCVTPQYLNAVIKDTRGETASAIIKRVTILTIEAKLKSSTASIQEIANSLNFPNASFFSKFFKRETGMTPKQYRDS